MFRKLPKQEIQNVTVLRCLRLGKNSQPNDLSMLYTCDIFSNILREVTLGVSAGSRRLEVQLRGPLWSNRRNRPHPEFLS